MYLHQIRAKRRPLPARGFHDQLGHRLAHNAHNLQAQQGAPRRGSAEGAVETSLGRQDNRVETHDEGPVFTPQVRYGFMVDRCARGSRKAGRDGGIWTQLLPPTPDLDAGPPPVLAIGREKISLRRATRNARSSSSSRKPRRESEAARNLKSAALRVRGQETPLVVAPPRPSCRSITASNPKPITGTVRVFTSARSLLGFG